MERDPAEIEKHCTAINGFAFSSQGHPPTLLSPTMSGDMRDWRPLLSTAAGKLNSFKGYLASKDPRPFSPASSSVSLKGGTDPVSPGADPGPATRQSWTQWAGDKLRRGNQYQGDNANVVEKVALFPGWAARRLHRSSPGEGTRTLCSCVVPADFLGVCHRYSFRCRGFCCGICFKTQQS